MSQLKVSGFAVSIDGYGAGPGQSLADPIGIGGMALHEWAFSTRTFQRLHGHENVGATGVDDDRRAAAGRYRPGGPGLSLHRARGHGARDARRADALTMLD